MPNTEGVPGAPGFYLVALINIRRISLSRIMHTQIDTSLCQKNGDYIHQF